MTTNRKESPAGRKPKPQSKPASGRRRQSAVVKELVQKVEAKLQADVDTKATLADYIKLVQLQKELEEEEPTEIRVTWVDPEETESGS